MPDNILLYSGLISLSKNQYNTTTIDDTMTTLTVLLNDVSNDRLRKKTIKNTKTESIMVSPMLVSSDRVSMLTIFLRMKISDSRILKAEASDILMARPR